MRDETVAAGAVEACKRVDALRLAVDASSTLLVPLAALHARVVHSLMYGGGGVVEVGVQLWVGVWGVRMHVSSRLVKPTHPPSPTAKTHTLVRQIRNDGTKQAVHLTLVQAWGMLPAVNPAQMARSTSAVAILPLYCAPLMRMVGRMNTCRKMVGWGWWGEVGGVGGWVVRFGGVPV